MSPAAKVIGLCGLASLLGLAAARGWAPDDSAEPALAPPPLVIAGQRLPVPRTPDLWVATSLERPLFSPDRRPPAVDAAAPTATAAAPEAPADLPRLSGIMVGGGLRQAIFAPSGTKPLTVAEGAHVGTYTVVHITPFGVEVQGPHGTQILHVVLQPPAAAAPAGLPGARQRADARG